MAPTALATPLQPQANLRRKKSELWEVPENGGCCKVSFSKLMRFQDFLELSNDHLSAKKK